MSDEGTPAGAVRIVLDGDGAFPELQKDMAAGKVKRARLSDVMALPGGMDSGNTSVGFIGEMEDGTKVLMETSLRIFQSAAGAFKGRYGDESGGFSFVAQGKDIVGGWGGGKSSG